MFKTGKFQEFMGNYSFKNYQVIEYSKFLCYTYLAKYFKKNTFLINLYINIFYRMAI